jgi:arginyl-tRNA synthetase
MVLAKKDGKNPRELAEEIAEKLRSEIASLPESIHGETEFQKSDIEKITVAGPGFINFYLTRKFFKKPR